MVHCVIGTLIIILIIFIPDCMLRRQWNDCCSQILLHTLLTADVQECNWIQSCTWEYSRVLGHSFCRQMPCAHCWMGALLKYLSVSALCNVQALAVAIRICIPFLKQAGFLLHGRGAYQCLLLLLVCEIYEIWGELCASFWPYRQFLLQAFAFLKFAQ